MKSHFTLSLPLLAALVLTLSGCGQSEEAARQARIDAAQANLEFSEGGQLLAKAIEAHGGLEPWFGNGLLKFRWIYRMQDRGPEAVVDTVQTIDPWSSMAVHEVPGGEITFGWTGEEAWILPADAEFSPPPHFWSLTPFYFLGVPFVLADPGTNHELLPDTVAFEGTDYPMVKVTFDAGTGESPDDYYKVLIHPETNQVAGVIYIVTDKKVNPDGNWIEKLLSYDTYQEVNGVKLPTIYRSFSINEDGTIGEKIREAEALDIEYLPAGSVDFGVPDGAKVYE